MKSQLLDHCYVCGVRFVTANPPGTANEEVHHVVPRAFGGTDGPLVSLCDSCHSKVHKLANMLLFGRTDFSLLEGLDNDSRKRLYYLANVIVRAQKLAENDPNKRTLISFKISGEDAQKLDFLKRVLNVTSREQVYNLALESLFNKFTH